MFQSMSTTELRTYLQGKSQPTRWFSVGWGNLWPKLLLIVPLNLMQCIWATQYHMGVTYYGMPMNLVWIWFSLVFAALALGDLGWATAQNKRQLQALTELCSRPRED